MQTRIHDLRIKSLRPISSPALLHHHIPLTEDTERLITQTRQDIDRILQGDDDRLLVVVGPCSIHDVASAKEYGQKLKVLAEQYKETLCIVMRVYFEKPRTSIGWKGLINDPHLNNSYDIDEGLRRARQLLVDLAAEGVPAATEFLDTIIPQFIADVICWGAIGARTTESQVHRELASGLSMPIGFKNGTDGNIQIAIDAIKSAAHPHHFLSISHLGVPIVAETTGNKACHVILRGGQQGPNYDSASVRAASERLSALGLNSRLMVDCSHGNSQKAHKNQLLVVENLAEQLSHGEAAVMGVMIESHLEEGRQDLSEAPLKYGQSITDACIHLDDTEKAFSLLASAVKGRRSHGQ